MVRDQFQKSAPRAPPKPVSRALPRSRQGSPARFRSLFVAFAPRIRPTARLTATAKTPRYGTIALSGLSTCPSNAFRAYDGPFRSIAGLQQQMFRCITADLGPLGHRSSKPSSHCQTSPMAKNQKVFSSTFSRQKTEKTASLSLPRSRPRSKQRSLSSRTDLTPRTPPLASIRDDPPEKSEGIPYSYRSFHA